MTFLGLADLIKNRGECCGFCRIGDWGIFVEFAEVQNKNYSAYENYPKNLFLGIVFYTVSAYNKVVRRFTVCGMETLFIQTRFTMYGSGTLFTQTRFTMCGRETLFTSLRCEPEAFFDKTSTDDAEVLL